MITDLITKTGDFIVEFAITDLLNKFVSIKIDGDTLRTTDGSRESLVYTVIRTVCYPDPVGCLTSPAPFELPDKLRGLIWHLADICESGHYWILASFTDEKDIRELSTTSKLAREVRRKYGGTALGVSGDVLASLPVNSKFYISEYAGTGHFPGFRFLAVPTGSRSDDALTQMLEFPEQHPGMIGDLVWDYDCVFSDSLFEVRPFGEENRDHIEVVMPSDLTRDRMREIIRQVYSMPYLVAELSLSEYADWEWQCKLDRLRLNPL